MQYLARMLCLLLVLALFGCGGENRTSNPTGGGGGPSTTPPPPVQNSATNWQFSTTSAVSEMPALTISGSVGRSGSAISAKFHVDGSNCFDPLSTVTLTGTLTNDDLSLTSNSVADRSPLSPAESPTTPLPGGLHRDNLPGHIPSAAAARTAIRGVSPASSYLLSIIS